MQLGEISFCDRIGFNIKDDNYKKSILEILERQFGFKVIQKHHERFDYKSPNSLKRISNVPHLLSTKTNGNPYLLFLTKHNFANQCIFIDKKIQHGYFTPRMIVVKLWFNDSLFENTLFDGEMIKDKNGKWLYIMNDIIGKQNKRLADLKLVQRVSIIYKTLSTDYFEDETACCQIKVKKYFKLEDFEYIIREYIPKLSYSCRGIYFKPIYSNFNDLLYNFDDSLVKNVKRERLSDLSNKSFFTNKKEVNTMVNERRRRLSESSQSVESFSSKSSISVENIENDNDKIKTHNMNECNDVFMQNIISSNKSNPELPENYKKNKVFCVSKTKTPDVYELSDVQDNSTGEKLIACVQNQTTSKLLRSIFNSLTFLEKVEMICEFNHKFNKWVPIQKV